VVAIPGHRRRKEGGKKSNECKAVSVVGRRKANKSCMLARGLRGVCGRYFGRQLGQGTQRAVVKTMSASGDRRRLRGIVFDMDGTVTVPVINFKEMRARVGVPPGHDILDWVSLR
jgi:hypothetical protein